MDKVQMEISVIYTTQLKAALGRSGDAVKIHEGSTVLDAVHKLATIEGAIFEQFVLRDEKPLPSILVSVNDKQVDFDTKLVAGDQVTLLSAISGG